MERFLLFSLAGAIYAVPLHRVNEIFGSEGVVPVPGAPAFVRGLLDTRQAVIPVVDLAAKFGLPARPRGRAEAILIVEIPVDGKRAPMGVLADQVLDVVEIDPATLEPPPALGAGIRLEFLKGTVRLEERLVLVLSLDEVLTATESEALRGVVPDVPAVVEAPAPAAESTEERPSPPCAVLSFRVSERTVGIEVSRVREILEYGEVTRVPGAPTGVLGALNVRGMIVPVLDLSRVYGWPPSTVTARSGIILLDVAHERGATPLGIVADAVEGIAEIPVEALESAPDFGLPLPRAHVRGLAKAGDGFMPLLEIDQTVASLGEGA